MPRSSAPDRLRKAIDGGRSGDKVPFSDPAAAPLGTDDEAAGTPLPPSESAAVLAEVNGDTAARSAPAVSNEDRGRIPTRRIWTWWHWAFVAVGFAALAVLAAVATPL
ncbi:hypothetical protein [Segnochrobactrum spirostomi]|uniref:Uncharacterized protein n=1 Tax=Segnochrobactrum spirostomi TaxID=2608987 RepID=A0A6A7YB93_9HYPH|nr:hypothetical protein [Segnochrobactrum spirostomi]MQT14689.1 hypothetical protein [Segnochrobactrum spirostomi]